MAASKKVIQSKDFPTGRPFSPGILVDDTLYIAGQTGADLKSGQFPEDFDAEVKQCLDNIGLVLKEAGMSFGDAVSGAGLPDRHGPIPAYECGLHEEGQ